MALCYLERKIRELKNRDLNKWTYTHKSMMIPLLIILVQIQVSSEEFSTQKGTYQSRCSI
jgi:hypothetical protein